MSSEVMRYRLEHNTPAREVQPGRDINILRGTVMVTEADHGRTIDALLAERDAARMRIKELDLLFGRYLLAMKAAVIDSDQRGAEQGMRWIYNSLAGPGELPAEDEIDAQAFFDREIKPIDDAMAELFAALQGEQP